MIINMIVTRIRDSFKFEHAETFNEELNRQCGVIVIPGSIVAIFSWIIFIPLDRYLYPGLPIIIYFRLGLFVVGFLALGLYFTSYFRPKGYLLLSLIDYYLLYATAIILGIVAADPVYMGGFCIVILVIAFAPFRVRHAYFLLLSSLLVFVVVGIFWGMKFKKPNELYGLYNLLIAVSITVLGTLVFDRLRKNSYENNVLIKKTNVELQKANKTKSELLQIAAHDLKDPLQVIIGYTDMLQMKFHGDPFAKDKLDKIYRSTDHMIKLITGLLEIASIESGKLVLNETEIDLKQLAYEVIGNNQPASEKKNQEIVCEAGNGCIITGDKMLVQQVLENLVGNAVKFSPQRKTIWVTVARLDSMALFKVRDEGPGLTEEDKKKLFGKFQRLSAKPTGKESSTGLGLALARELVVLHGGTIRVESEYGKGCEFIVELPMGNVNRII